MKKENPNLTTGEVKMVQLDLEQKVIPSLTWAIVFSSLERLAKEYGPKIDWDFGDELTWGQALTVEVYGANYYNDDRWIADAKKPLDEEAPIYLLETLADWEEGYFPPWLKTQGD